MAPSPDLFVVCKNCQAEVSPYITECPYCGHRLRKRAPKLEKGGVPKPRKERRPAADRPPRLGRLRAGEIPGIRGERRPYASLALVVVPTVLTLLVIFSVLDPLSTLLLGLLEGKPWRALVSAFVYFSTGYQLVALAATFLFGWLLERRHGWWAPVAVFLGGTFVGAAAAVAVDADAAMVGGNAGALALLGAWAARDLLALRRRQETEADWLGVLAIAVVLLVLPVAYPVEVDPVAGITGGLAGLLAGLGLARLREH